MTVESHIPGALSIPLDELRAAWTSSPPTGRWWPTAAVPTACSPPKRSSLLAAQGIRARRLADGLPEWRLAGHPVAVGALER